MKTWFAIPLWQRVIAALVLGVIVGFVWGPGAESIKIIGDIFIAFIKMLVVPLIFFSLVAGVASIGDLRKLGSVGWRALLLFVGTLGGQDEDRHFAAAIAAHSLDQPEPIHTRHVDVGDHQVGRQPFQLFEGMDAIFRFFDLVAEIGQCGAQQHAHTGRIIDCEYRLCHRMVLVSVRWIRKIQRRLPRSRPLWEWTLSGSAAEAPN